LNSGGGGLAQSLAGFVGVVISFLFLSPIAFIFGVIYIFLFLAIHLIYAKKIAKDFEMKFRNLYVQKRYLFQFQKCIHYSR